VRLLSGTNNHHCAEAAFKSLARAMRAALTIDERLSGETPSTKGVIG
jgi:imidazoleglycerol-phosphate dehydratase